MNEKCLKLFDYMTKSSILEYDDDGQYGRQHHLIQQRILRCGRLALPLATCISVRMRSSMTLHIPETTVSPDITHPTCRDVKVLSCSGSGPGRVASIGMNSAWFTLLNYQLIRWLQRVAIRRMSVIFDHARA